MSNGISIDSTAKKQENLTCPPCLEVSYANAPVDRIMLRTLRNIAIIAKEKH